MGNTYLVTSRKRLAKSLGALFFFCLGTPSVGYAISVEVSDAPDNDLTLAVAAIQSATTTLHMNIYEFSSPDIANAVINRIQNKVEVQILEEGQPVGGYSKASGTIRNSVIAAMNEAGANVNNHFYMMKKDTNGDRRFRYDHAKYTVIDSKSLLIGSENYSPTGNADGGKANRGWEVFIHDPAVAQQFSGIFQSDSDTANSDITDASRPDHLALQDFSPLVIGGLVTKAAVAKLRHIGDGDLTTLNAESITSFTSPDSSLEGLTSLIASSEKSLELELMTFTPDWGGVGKVSPLLKAVQAAGKKHKNVKVLLNDNKVFAKDGEDGAIHNTAKKDKNVETVETLNNTKGEVVAAIANLKAMGVTYIHNKGALVDGDKVLISSINWDQNSVEHNRESAVVITGSDIYEFYQALYEKDWADSTAGQ
jgi:cardiolipin synthase